MPFVPWSIEERHILHGLRLPLRVHHDSVPAVQSDRRMIGVPNAALDVHARIPTHRAPTPSLRLRVACQDLLVFLLGDPVRVTRADVDRLAARPVAELGPMWLTAVAPAQWFIRQDQLLCHDEARNRQEEPLTLADESGVLAAVAGLGPEALAGLGARDLGGLQCLLGLADGADWSLLRNAGDEPVALVVAAKELALVLALTNEQELVAVGGLNIKYSDFNIDAGLGRDLEELALAVGLHLQGNDACHAVAAGRTISDLQPSAHTSKLDVEQVGVHKREDTKDEGRVRSLLIIEHP